MDAVQVVDHHTAVKATLFADGQVDRSPCGSGTSARLALLAAGRPAVVTEIEGNAYRTGTATFELDPRDPLGAGFVLR